MAAVTAEGRNAVIPPLRRAFSGAALALACALSAHAQTLTWLNGPPPGTPITEPPRLTLSLSGRGVPAIIDTGSTGIVVSADLIPNFASLAGRPGTLTYSSSGRVMHGRWVTARATLAGAHGRRVTTRPLPVLAVTSETCWNQAPLCIEAGAAPPVCGVSLMDTGVVNMYLASPGATPGPGTRLEFLLGGPHPVARYAFTIGQHASPMAPRAVVLTHHPHAFANLTIRFLNGFDYLYDATEGEVGYRADPLP